MPGHGKHFTAEIKHEDDGSRGPYLGRFRSLMMCVRSRPEYDSNNPTTHNPQPTRARNGTRSQRMADDDDGGLQLARRHELARRRWTRANRRFWKCSNLIRAAADAPFDVSSPIAAYNAP